MLHVAMIIHAKINDVIMIMIISMVVVFIRVVVAIPSISCHNKTIVTASLEASMVEVITPA